VGTVFPVYQHLCFVQYFRGQAVIGLGVGRDVNLVTNCFECLSADSMDTVRVDGTDVVFYSFLYVLVPDGN